MTRTVAKIGKPCQVSGKRKYRTEGDALVAFSNHPRMIRVYLCPDCGFWHGTRKYKDAA